MAWIGETIIVGSEATLLLNSNINQKRRELKNVGSDIVFIGSNNSVQDSNGFPLRPLETISIGDYNGTIYGITTDSLNRVTVFEDE